MMERTRCDKRSILVKTLRGLSGCFILAVVILINLLDRGDGEELEVLEWIGRSLFMTVGLFFLTVFVLVVVTALYHTLRWRKTWIWIEDDTLYEERSLLFAKRKSVKLSAISTVNLQQNLLERVFRLYHLKLDFQSSATADQTDFDLIFDEKTAHLWMDLILQKETKSLEEYEKDVMEADAFAPMGNEGRQYRFGEVLRHSILSLSLFQIFLFLCSIITVVCEMFFVEEVMETGDSVEIVFLVIVFAGSAVLGIVKNLLGYYGFSFAIKDGIYHLNYGLLTKHAFEMDPKKSSAIVMQEPFLCRMFGYAYAELIQVGLGNESEQGERPIVCLCMKKDDCWKLIQEMVPEYQEEAEWVKMDRRAWCLLHPSYFWGVCTFFVGFLVAMILFGVAEWYIYPIACGVVAVLLLLGVLFQLLRIKASGMSVQETHLIVTNGCLGKKTHIIAYKNVQQMMFRESILARKRGLKEGHAVLLGAVLHRIVSLPYVSGETLAKVEERVMDV